MPVPQASTRRSPQRGARRFDPESPHPLGETLARLDLPIQLGEDAGAVIDAAIAERDAAWHLARVDFPGGSLWVRDNGQPIGHRVRVRVLARDVSLAHSKGEDSSILNALPAKVVAVADDTHPAMVLVRLDVGNSPLLARLTKRSIAALGVREGMDVWARIKAVALIG